MRETLSTLGHTLADGDQVLITKQTEPLIAELSAKGFPVRQEGDKARTPAHLQPLAWQKLDEIRS